MKQQTSSKFIALDVDGVLLDYNAAYATAWKNAFDVAPKVVNRNAYWAMDRYAVPRLTGTELDKFRASFNEKFWSTIPLIDGALEACKNLLNLGYDLVCVTALPAKYLDARRFNLLSHGLPIKDVYAVDHFDSIFLSPKAELLNQLMPVAFVDDYLPYFKGISDEIHTALVTREQDGSPNTGIELVTISTRHKNLLEFSNWLGS